MNPTFSIAALLCVSATGLYAQEGAPAKNADATDMKKASAEAAKTQDTPGVRYVIRTTSAITVERKIMVDGEERAGGRGGNREPQPTKTSMTLEFEEGAEGKATWRSYSKAEASVERSGRDGEPTTANITSALAGKKLFLTEAEDGALEAHEGKADGAALDARLVRGLPMRTDLSGLVPAAESMAVDTEAAIDAKFGAALRSLVHPVRARNEGGNGNEGRQGRRGRGAEGDEGQEPRGGGEGRQPRGRRGRGGEENGEGGGEQPRGRRGRGGAGGGEGNGEGGRGRRGRNGGQDGDAPQGRGDRNARRGAFGRRNTNANDTALSTLSSAAMQWTGTWKVESIEESATGKVATIRVEATGKGEGKPEDLGMQSGTRNRRRGGGGNQQAGSEAAGRASMKLSGTYTVDVASGTVRELKLEGVLDASVKMSMMRRESEFEINSASSGPFTISVERSTATNADKK